MTMRLAIRPGRLQNGGDVPLETQKEWSTLIQGGVRITTMHIPAWLVGALEAFFPKKVLLQIPMRTFWAYYVPASIRGGALALWQQLGILLEPDDLPHRQFIAVVEEHTHLVGPHAQQGVVRERSFYIWSYVVLNVENHAPTIFSTWFYAIPDILWMFLWLNQLQHRSEISALMKPIENFECDETLWLEQAHEEALRQATAQNMDIDKFIEEELKRAFPDVYFE